jgi:hypothetical protein
MGANSILFERMPAFGVLASECHLAYVGFADDFH